MRPERVLRIGGVLVVGLVGLPETLQVLLENAASHHTPWPQLLLMVYSPVVALCGLFWWATREATPAGWPLHCATAAEILLCFFTATELIHVVAAQIAVTLRSRAAVMWFVALNLALLGFGAAAYLDGSFEAMTGISALPKPAQAAVTLLAMTGWNLFAFAAGRLIVDERQQRLHVAQLNLELIAARQDLERAAGERERMRIARDLHDTLGHHLTALAASLDLAQRLPLDRSREVLGRAHLLARLLLSDLRETVSQMRNTSESVLTPNLGEALSQMAARLEGAARIDIQVDPTAARVDPKTGEVVLHTAREGVTNALRHARASRVLVKLTQVDREWLLTISDNGRAVPPIQPGNGLKGIQERARELGGELQIVAARSVTLQLRLPVVSEVRA